ncbi:MAG: S9 family peptidase [Chloroflexi bacterium]|nr:S9 family peptidase [Chloroflexota bacterium]
MPKHPISKLLRIPQVHPWPGGLSLSPKGDYAAISWNRSGSWEIWLVPLDGGKPQRLTSQPHTKSAPRFSPEGSRVGFLQDYDGDEKYDLFTYNLDSGQTRNLMPNTDDTLNDTFSWAPDGCRVAIVSNRGGRMAAHVLDLASGAMRRISEHSYSDYEAVWSPDGKHIAFTAQTRGQSFGLFIADAENSKETRALSDDNGLLDAHSPRWSPDGKRLAFVGYAADTANIGVFDLESGEIDWVGVEKRENDSPSWSPDGAQLAHTVNREGDVSLVVIDLRLGRRRRFAVEPGYHVEPQFTPDGKSIVCVFHNARRPADLWKLDLASGKWTRLTRSLPGEMKPSHFIQPAVVRWKAPDGLAISGLLFVPKGKAKRRPLLINVHGGPSWQYMNCWDPLTQLWLAEGWAVLCPNYRGSTGYGKKFQEANRYVMGQADIADIVAGAQAMIRKGIADPKRIGITGASYGGYMTMVGLTRYPETFAVGSAVVPFMDWFTEFESERDDLRYWDLQNMGDPKEAPDRFREASPMFFLDRIAAPVQMLAGAHDPRCPAAETQHAADELTRMGKTHDTLIFPDEGHGFMKMKNRLTAYQRQLKFLKKHL